LHRLARRGRYHIPGKIRPCCIAEMFHSALAGLRCNCTIKITRYFSFMEKELAARRKI
jgi:hypothetical protein